MQTLVNTTEDDINVNGIHFSVGLSTFLQSLMVTKRLQKVSRKLGLESLFWFATPEPIICHYVTIAFTISILLLRSKLSSWPSLSICEQNETRKPNRVVIIFVDYKLLFSLEVSNPNLCTWETVANPSVLSAFWVDFLECPTWSDIVSGCKVHWIWWGKCCVHIYCTCFLIFIEIHWFR